MDGRHDQRKSPANEEGSFEERKARRRLGNLDKEKKLGKTTLLGNILCI